MLRTYVRTANEQPEGAWRRSLEVRHSTVPARSERRRWSFAALVWAVAMDALSLPTFGLAVFLAPLGAALTAVAWRRAPHDGIFWVGATLNGLAVLGLLAILVGLLTGEVGVGLD
jgi:hypothetical protein